MTMQKDQMFFIDLETTGVNVASDKICQIGALFPDGEQLSTLINPMRRIPKETSEIHGITDEMVLDAPTLKDVADQLISQLEKSKYFVAYNFIFDFQFLQKELMETVKYDLDENDFVFIDPYKIFKTMFPHNLTNAYKFYTGEDFTGAHDAMEDVTATLKILEKQHEKYPELFEKGYAQVAEETIGDTGILGRWFVKKPDGSVTFRQGKHRGEVVSTEHTSYLQWIHRLEDSTISEKRYIGSLIQVRA